MSEHPAVQHFMAALVDLHDGGTYREARRHIIAAVAALAAPSEAEPKHWPCGSQQCPTCNPMPQPVPAAEAQESGARPDVLGRCTAGAPDSAGNTSA